MGAGFHLSAFALLSIGAGVTLLVIAWRGWPFQRYPGAKTWTLILVTVALWDISYGIALATFDPNVRWWFNVLVLLGRALSIPLILAFALQYTGREELARSNWMYALLGFYIAAFLLAITNPVHELMWTGFHISPVFGAAAVDFTPRFYYVLAGVSYLTVLLAIVLLADTLARYRTVFGRQSLALIVALAVPSLANVIWMFRLGPTQHLDLTPVGHIVIASLLTYALFREDMFKVVPATRFKAEQAALEDLASAVFSVTNDGLIVNLNAEAADLIGSTRDAVLLRSLSDFLQIEFPPADSNFNLSNPFGGKREYTVAVSEIVSERDNVIGYTVALQDITAERIRQQRLTVLNRVLRHNLRNDLNVVDGYAEILDQEVPEAGEYARRIRETVGELITIGEKAQRIEQIVATQGEAETADVSEVVRRTVEDVRPELNDCEIVLKAVENDVAVNRRVLSAVLRELIENGCRYNDATDPEVRITVERNVGPDDQLTITVADNGPGIPVHELAPLREGTETALEHGSGLGLWLVQWGVSILNGEIDFEQTGPRGTTVTIRLPI